MKAVLDLVQYCQGMVCLHGKGRACIPEGLVLFMQVQAFMILNIESSVLQYTVWFSILCQILT